MKHFIPFAVLFVLYSCSSAPVSSKKVDMPFPKGTVFKVSQGAFGSASHFEKGNEYSWDFDVPYGTDVLAIEDGSVIEVWEPKNGGGCDSKFSNDAHNIKIELNDGVVVQYVHVNSLVKRGSLVRKGEVVAKTAMNGFICTPQLHFGIYQSRNHLYSSPQRRTLPLSFSGFSNGNLDEGKVYKVK